MTVERGTGRLSGMEFLHVHARRIINEVPAASRMPFRLHDQRLSRLLPRLHVLLRPADARLPRAEHRRATSSAELVVKVNAVERLRAELRSPQWPGDPIAMGTNTDPYQRCEGKYRLTRGHRRGAGRGRQPVLDPDQVHPGPARPRPAGRGGAAHRRVGVASRSARWTRRSGGPPSRARRTRAGGWTRCAQLNDAGIPSGVLVAPVLPGLSDSPAQLEEVVDGLRRGRGASVTAIALHLRPGVREHFLGWLRPRDPGLADDYERRYQRSYCPDEEQKALAARVRAIAERAGARYATPAEARVPSGEAWPPSPTPHDRPAGSRLSGGGSGRRRRRRPPSAQVVVGAERGGVDAQPAVHLPAAHLEPAHVRPPDQGLLGLRRVDAQQHPALAARADRHVAVDQERQPAEHPLLGQAVLARHPLADPVGQLLVVRHRSSIGAATDISLGGPVGDLTHLGAGAAARHRDAQPGPTPGDGS